MPHPPPTPAALQEVLFRIFERLASPGELAAHLAAIHGELWSILDASNLYVAVYDSASELYFFPYNADRDDQDFAPQALRKSLTDYVRRTGRALFCRQPDLDALVRAGEVERIGVPSPVWLGAPLITGRGPIGAIVVQSYDDPEAYAPHDLETLMWVARAMAIPIERGWTAERERIEAEMRIRDLMVSRDEAMRASQEKSRFFANMSHELRTPRNAILGYTDLLLDEIGDPEVVRDLHAIRSAASHLRALIDGVLDLTQVESGRLELAPTTFSVVSLFDQIEQQVMPLVQQGRNQLVRVGEVEAGEVHTDRRALLQVVLNLVGNACKFTENGRISLRARRLVDDGRLLLRIEVSDTGIGIDPAVLPRLFGPFTQVDPSSTRKAGGSGLGLAIARRLTERLGGELGGASVPGRGTTFSLKVPAVLGGAGGAQAEGVPLLSQG
jgi:signal transduction histidine kinase